MFIGAKDGYTGENMSPSLGPSSSSKLGHFIKRLRLLMQGQTEKSFSTQVGLHQATFRRYLDGSEPSRKSLIAIANGANVTIQWLATGEGPMRPVESLMYPEDESLEEDIARMEAKMAREDAESLRKTGKPKVWRSSDVEMDEGTALMIRVHLAENSRLSKENEALRAAGFGGGPAPSLALEQEIAELKRRIEAQQNLLNDTHSMRNDFDAKRREIELLKEMAALKQLVKQPPPPPTTSGIANMTLLGLAECGLAGWQQKRPLSVKANCPADMNPAEDFAVMATGHSLFYAGIEPGFICFCAPKSEAQVGDVVFVLKPNNLASLGLVKELKRKEGGVEWLVLQKWDDPNPKTGERKPYTLKENMDEIEQVVPVIYVQRRAV